MEQPSPRTAGGLTRIGDAIVAEAIRLSTTMSASDDTPPSATVAPGTETGMAVPLAPPPQSRGDDDDPDWLLHETRLLRQPVYRTERTDSEDEPIGSYFDQPVAGQLPLFTYEYNSETTVVSRIGELGTRDMLVMAVVSQAFYATGCPADNKVHGDQATLGCIARQLGMHPEGATRLIRASVERLSTARVKFKRNEVEPAARGGPVTTRGEITIGFLANFGWRERQQKGVVTNRDNFVQIDQTMADLIRNGQFTFLRAEVLRTLRRQPLALKLYAWARTHRPDDRGRIFYGVSKLARHLGCSDQNSTRRRRKMAEAAKTVCDASPDEFPGYEVRPGQQDQVLVLRKAKNRSPSLLQVGI